MFRSTICFTLATAACLLFTISSAQAQYLKPQASSASTQHAKIVSKACLGKWETQSCLKAVSDSALVMISNYAAKLKKNGKGSSLETLKEHCAASTAASNGEYPADAMVSAYVECANIISDINDATGLMPDQSHYQLLVGPVLCIRKDRRCAAIEEGLRKYR